MKTVNNQFKKLDAAIPVAGKAVYFAFAGARAKMLGKTYADVLNFLQYEFTLPETEETWKKRQGKSFRRVILFCGVLKDDLLPPSRS